MLELCTWVLKQRDADVKRDTSDRYWAEEDRDWSWTRNAIAYLLEVTLSGDKGKIPFELRYDVWNLLAYLSDDPEPTPDREVRQLENNTPPSEVSINATRGVAMHAIVHYALWVRNQLGKSRMGQPPVVSTTCLKYVTCSTGIYRQKLIHPCQFDQSTADGFRGCI